MLKQAGLQCAGLRVRGCASVSSAGSCRSLDGSRGVGGFGTSHTSLEPSEEIDNYDAQGALMYEGGAGAGDGPVLVHVHACIALFR